MKPTPLLLDTFNQPARMNMNTTLATLSRIVAMILLMAALTPARAANFKPPERITYQGHIVDASNTPLGNTTPVNYTVVFRIYDSSTAGATPLWSESQVVTFDNGQFSVLLGEGSEYSTEPHASLSSVFASSTASDRYIGVTVVGLGDGKEMQPRMHLVTSPYAFLARFASALVGTDGASLISAVPGGNVGIGTDTPTAKLEVTGSVKATSFAGDGSALSNLTLPSNAATLDKNNQTFTGNKNTFAKVVATEVTVNSPGAFIGYGTIPIGGIIMWSGATADIPAGWALCNGAVASGKTTPDLRNRFIVSIGNSYAVGETGGDDSVRLTDAQVPLRAHTHTVSDKYDTDNNLAGQPNITVVGAGNEEAAGDGVARYTETRTTSSASLAATADFDNRPRFYALAFIMRVL